MSTAEKTGRETLYTVQVRDPNGQRSVFLEGVKGSDSVKNIREGAMGQLRLTEEVDWNVRDDSSGRLLRDDQTFGEVVGSSTMQVVLSMQPDAGLG